MSAVRDPYPATIRAIERNPVMMTREEGAQYACGCQHLARRWWLCCYHDGFEIGYEEGEQDGRGDEYL